MKFNRRGYRIALWSSYPYFLQQKARYVPVFSKNVGPGEFDSRRFREPGFAFRKGENDCPKSILMKTEAFTARTLIIYLPGNCKNRAHSIRCPLREFLEGCRPPLHPVCKGMSTRYFMRDISCHLRTYNMERWRVKPQVSNREGKKNRGGKEK